MKLRAPSRSAPFDEQVAGRVAADVAGVRGQVEELLLAAEHDLDLLDRAAVALEAVVDPRADEPAAELRERPVQEAPSPIAGVAMLECDLGRRRAPGSRRRAGEPGAEDRLGRAVEEALRDRLAVSAPTVVPGRRGPAPRRSRPTRPRRAVTIVRVSSARPGAARRPAEGDRARRPSRPSATSTWRPWLQKPRASWASLSSGGKGRAAVEDARKPSGSRASHSDIVSTCTPAGRRRRPTPGGRRPARPGRRGRTARRPRATAARRSMYGV